MRYAVAAAVVVLILAVAVSLFAWPTLWRYDEVTIRFEGSEKQLVRTHRITGRSEKLTKWGWIELGAMPRVSAPVATQPAMVAEPAPATTLQEPPTNRPSGRPNPYADILAGLGIEDSPAPPTTQPRR